MPDRRMAKREKTGRRDKNVGGKSPRIFSSVWSGGQNYGI